MYHAKKVSQLGVDRLYSDLFSSGLRAVARKHSPRSTRNRAHARTDHRNNTSTTGIRRHNDARIVSNDPQPRKRERSEREPSPIPTHAASSKGLPPVVSSFRLWLREKSNSNDVGTVKEVQGKLPLGGSP